MHDVTFSSPIPTNAQTLADWHARPGAFERLAPPWETLKIVSQAGGIEDGAKLIFKVYQGPIGLTWEAHHDQYIAGAQFRDVQHRGPFSTWEHTHRFIPIDDTHSTLSDEVRFQLPLEPLSAPIVGLVQRHMLQRMFDFRHRRTMQDLERHEAFASQPRQRIAITGSTGLIGTALKAFLTTGGHTVLPVVRHKPVDEGSIYWKPSSGEIDAEAFEGVDVVIHLAGAGVADKRWDEDHKRLVLESRTQGTRLLAQTLAGLKKKPRVLLSASAIGYYGDRDDELLTEQSSTGQDFLADACLQWEEAAQPARDAGIKVIHPRIGLVLAAQGGLLGPMLTPFKLGLGGKIGDGKQYMSWIALDDVLGALYHLMFQPDVEGPVNIVAPNPVTNAKFTKALGSVLGRPTFMSVPAFAIRAAMGEEMANSTALVSQRVRPGVLELSGFKFFYPEVKEALAHELGK